MRQRSKEQPELTKTKPLDPVEDFEEPTRVPVQEDLPSMEEPEIQELETLAAQYAVIRDKRIKLNEKEGELKKDLLTKMKAHGKQQYEHGNVSIKIITEEETVKVRIKREEEESPEE